MINKSQETFEPIESNSKLKSYFCPHCKKLLMNGNVKRLKMTCPICQTMIDVEERKLLKPEKEDGKSE